MKRHTVIVSIEEAGMQVLELLGRCGESYDLHQIVAFSKQSGSVVRKALRWNHQNHYVSCNGRFTRLAMVTGTARFAITNNGRNALNARTRAG
jgi:hypothetical protein